MTENSKTSTSEWLHPNQVLQLHRLKAKKKALQARINSSDSKGVAGASDSKITNLNSIIDSAKRKNPFITTREDKKPKTDAIDAELDDASNQTLFKLLHLSTPNTQGTPSITSFNDALKINEQSTEQVHIVKAKGEPWIPVDWSLKTKIRFLSAVPFAWNQKLKISEEASGVTGFTRCLDSRCTTTSLDTSPNAKFHQCCLYWQQPSLPWLSLFPRTNSKMATPALVNMYNSAAVRDSLLTAWTDSFRSLFQLIRTRQCPYFYVCANNFTVLFRAGGIGGFTEMHAMITPTSRGLRHMLRQEEIEYSMPLKLKRLSDQGYDTGDSTFGSQLSEGPDLEENEEKEEDDEPPDEQWLHSMGINAEDIKQINYSQANVERKTESEVDNSEQSLVLIEGMEVHALYNFLINCKTTVAITGPLAGVPPTLLAPVAFNGATLNSLKVRQNKVHVDNVDYHSLELSGPILPNTIHNLCLINPPEHSITATFSSVAHTLPFSKIKNSEQNDNSKEKNCSSGSTVFGQENLSDCGLNLFVLKRFCSPHFDSISNVECLKYSGDTKTFTWT